MVHVLVMVQCHLSSNRLHMVSVYPMEVVLSKASA